MYPSVPLDKSIQVTTEILQEGHAELKKKTKLNITDIGQLPKLCLSEWFRYNNVMWTLENLGLKGLSVMVILSECYY